MNNDQRKILTEYIGECWHVQHDPQTPLCYKCLSYIPEGNRTFTTPDDQHAVMQAIVKARKWRDFWSWCHCDYLAREESFLDINRADESEWLFSDPARFCELVGEWVQESR